MICEDEFRMVPAQGQQNIARSAGDGRLDHAAAFPAPRRTSGREVFPAVVEGEVVIARNIPSVAWTQPHRAGVRDDRLPSV